MSAEFACDGANLCARLSTLLASAVPGRRASLPGSFFPGLLLDLASLSRAAEPTIGWSPGLRVSGVEVRVPEGAARGLEPLRAAVERAGGTGLRVGGPIGRESLLRLAQGLQAAGADLEARLRAEAPSWEVLREGLAPPPDRRPAAAARAWLVERLTEEPVYACAPPAPRVRYALAAVLWMCPDDTLLALLAGGGAQEDPRARRGVRVALLAALVARGRGHSRAEELAVGLAALGAAQLPNGFDVQAGLLAQATPEAGATEPARASVLLGLTTPGGVAGGRTAPPPQDSEARPALTNALRVALAWERLAGEPPRMLPQEALAELRQDSQLCPDCVAALADVLGPLPVGSCWVLADGSLGVVVDHPADRPRTRVLRDPEGRPLGGSVRYGGAEGELGPHAAVDPAELGIDPAEALWGGAGAEPLPSG